MTEAICWICGGINGPNHRCSETVDPRIDCVLEQKYKVIRELGAGGMGKVYEGQNLRVGRRVAIKFLLPEFAANSEIVRRFENEARAAGGLEHENIAAVHDFGRGEDGACFLVMDFLSGEDCEQLLRREGPLPVARVVSIVLQVCRGLDVAHRASIVHRDLKPANLYLTKRADRSELVKILDFGIAKLRKTGDQPGTGTGQALGTPYYMSPEQARGDRDVDQRTDVYALGVILYELLSGQRPHDGSTYLEIIYSILHNAPEPLESRRSGLPFALGEIVRRAMNVDVSQRFACVAELGEALIPLAGVPVASFRSQPSVPPAAAQGDQTLASDKTAPKQTASTTAPLTPKTSAGIRAQSGSAKARIWLGAVATAVAVLGAGVWTVRSRSIPRVSATATATVLTAAAASIQPPSPPTLSGQMARPDASFAPAPSSAPSASPVSRSTRNPLPGRTPKEPEKKPVASVTPPVAAPSPPAHGPSPNTIDISREPNF